MLFRNGKSRLTLVRRHSFKSQRVKVVLDTKACSPVIHIFRKYPKLGF